MPRNLGGTKVLWTVGGFVILDEKKHAASFFPRRDILATSMRKAAIAYCKLPEVRPFFRTWLGSGHLGLWGTVMASTKQVTTH